MPTGLRCAPILGLLRREAATVHPTPVVVSVAVPAPDLEEEVEKPPRWAGPARGLLGVAGALVLAAPILIRNRGYTLPTEPALPGVLWLLVSRPCRLAADAGRSRCGPRPRPLRPPSAPAGSGVAGAPPLGDPVSTPGPASGTARNRRACGLLRLGAGATCPDGRRPLSASSNSIWEVDGRHLYFNYDGTTIVANLSAGTSSVVAVYPRGLRRGFTLVSTIPPSLSVGLLEVRAIPWIYGVAPWAYLIMRLSF